MRGSSSSAGVFVKSITEEAVEAAISGELASVKAGKDRLVEAITLGILTNEEAAGKLAELREQEQRLMVELSSIAEKMAIMEQWQAALDALKEQDITATLTELAKQKTIAFVHCIRAKQLEGEDRAQRGQMDRDIRELQAYRSNAKYGIFLYRTTELGIINKLMEQI